MSPIDTILAPNPPLGRAAPEDAPAATPRREVLSSRQVHEVLRSHGPSAKAARLVRADATPQQRVALEPPQPAATRPAPKDDIRGLAKKLVAGTLGRIGTDEELVYKTLQLAHAYGSVGALNDELGALLRQRGAGVPLKAGNDWYVRWLIDQELSGTQRRRALDFLEVGYDRLSSSDWAYRLEGALDDVDGRGDLVRDKPLLAAAGATALIGLSLLTPPVSVALGFGFLAYGAGKVVKNELEAAFFSKSRGERVQNLLDSGGGLANMASSASNFLQLRALAGAARTAKAVREVGTLGQAIRAFIVHGSLMEKVARLRQLSGL